VSRRSAFGGFSPACLGQEKSGLFILFAGTLENPYKHTKREQSLSESKERGLEKSTCAVLSPLPNKLNSLKGEETNETNDLSEMHLWATLHYLKKTHSRIILMFIMEILVAFLLRCLSEGFKKISP
jgi:hypothetical protein